FLLVFCFTVPPTTRIYPLSLHDALPIWDGALDPRHLEEVLLGLLDALGDRRGHLLGLAVADADGAVAVTDDHQGGEAEATPALRSEEHTSELQSRENLVCRLLLEKKKHK